MRRFLSLPSRRICLCEVKTTHNRLLLPHCQGGTEFYLFKYNSMAYDSNQYPDGLAFERRLMLMAGPR